MKVRVIAERSDEPRTSHMLHRGDFLQPEARSAAGHAGRAAAASKPRGELADRLDLARWLVDPRQSAGAAGDGEPLWSNLFGRGIVRTPGDFGVRGERPTHPELLDWLASELIARGWSRKEMIRLIVTLGHVSASLGHAPGAGEIDPAERCFHRQNRFRVEGEIVRDLTLAVAGLLSPKIGGPSVFPPLPPGIAELSYANNFKWNTSDRRGSLPPRHVHVLQAHRAAPEPDDVRLSRRQHRPASSGRPRTRRCKR